MKTSNIDTTMAIMLIASVLIITSLFQGKIKLNPNCDAQPNNPDCQCYDGKVKNQKTIQCLTTPCPPIYECIQPQCRQDTVNTDCKDRLHVLCVGNWNCIQNQCNWICS